VLEMANKEPVEYFEGAQVASSGVQMQESGFARISRMPLRPKR